MNKEVIAVVRLMPGQGGFFDELSRIHLTVGNPQASVFAGMNCAQLRRSVKSGRLSLLSGSLGEEIPPFKLVQQGDNYILAPNHEELAEAAVTTAVVTSTKAAADEAPKTVVDKKTETQPEDAPKEAVDAPAEAPVEEPAEEAVEEATEESTEEAQKDEQAPSKKKTSRKKAADK